MKHDFLTQPHNYTRTPRTMGDKWIEPHREGPTFVQVVVCGAIIAALVGLLIWLDGVVWL